MRRRTATTARANELLLFAEQKCVSTEHTRRAFALFASQINTHRDTYQDAAKWRLQARASRLEARTDTDISELAATEQQERLQGTELWCPVTQNWATVAMAQVIRNQLSAQHAKATLHIHPAEDHLLNLPSGSSLTEVYVASS